MDYKNIIFKEQYGIGYITINRPEALNALERRHFMISSRKGKYLR